MMEGRPWWVTAVQWTLWAVVMSFVMGWIASSRHRAASGVKPGQLRHPRSTLWIGAVSSGFFLLIALFASVLSKRPVEPWVYLGFAVFAAWGLYLVLEYFVVRYHVDDEGISWSTPLSGKGRMRWGELRRVTFSHSMKWFRLESSAGRSVRLSAMLAGLPTFARLIITRAPAGVIEERTLVILEDASTGNLPSIWG